MCWKKWKLGLAIAFGCGLLTAGAGLADQMSLKSFIAVLCTALLTNLLNYLKDHPVTQVDDAGPPATGGGAAKVGLFLLAVGLGWLLSGCAYMSAKTVRMTSTNPTNGVISVTETTHGRAYALFDSGAALTKVNVHSGYATNGTYSPGISASGLAENASSTNAVQVLNALGGVLGKIPW